LTKLHLLPQTMERQDSGLARISQGLAARRDFDPANVRVGSCVTSIAGPNGAAQLYER
jgi:hypothetical protein